jgi:hypothetical protein
MNTCDICGKSAPKGRKTCSKECSDERRSLSKMTPYRPANLDTEAPEVRLRNMFLLRPCRL